MPHNSFLTVEYQWKKSRGPCIYSQIRDENGNVCPNIQIADCGHKIGLNGVDNGRIWFDNVRIPRENLLNSVVDVCANGEYQSAIKDLDEINAASSSVIKILKALSCSPLRNCRPFSWIKIDVSMMLNKVRRSFTTTSNKRITTLHPIKSQMKHRKSHNLDKVVDMLIARALAT